MATTAVFGGSFNPPHVAHVLAVTYVLSVHEVDDVVVVPAFQHPFAKSLAPYEDRMRMCELAMAWIPHVSVSRVEEELGGESRTLRTLVHLAKAHPDWSLRLVMGADLVVESPKWHGFEKIKELAPPIVLGRVGVPLASAPPAFLPEVSSTAVRAHIAAGRWEEVAPYLPRAVLEHVRARKLYTSRTEPSAGEM
jgi:nicotinate-nucleotide adenylyltransferase